MSVTASGRVVSVRPRGDGTFGVLLGPGPDVYWYVTSEPPKLGAEVALRAEREAIEPLAWRGTAGRIHRLERVSANVSLSAKRVVAPQWMERVQAAMLRQQFPYQIDGAAWMASRLAVGKSAILSDDQGLGKSSQLTAALVATNLFPAIIVCPTSVKPNWMRELGWSARPLTVTTVNGRSGPIDPADVVLINYELLRYREEQLGNYGARVIAFDEAQRINEPKPGVLHVASVATRLALWIRRVVHMTGTPIENNAKDFWRLLHMIDPIEWPSYEEFVKRYCHVPDEDELLGDRRVVTDYGRVEHLDELQARIQPVMLRRLKEEVLPELPPKSRRSVLVQLEPYDMKHYRLAEAQIVDWLRAQGEFQAAGHATKVEALIRIAKLRHIAALGKLREAVPDYLQRWFERTGASQLVVFAYHQDVVAGTIAIAESLGLRAASIGGSDSQAKRSAAVDAFQTGQADVFVAPIRSAGAGLNLQSASDTLFLERTWLPSDLLQAEDRVHRIGSTRPVVATYMDAAGTIDEHMANVLDAKQTLVERLVDDREAVTFRAIEVLASRLAA